jgi:hypothetical protein
MDDVTVNSNRKPRPQSTADKKELSIPSYIIQTLIGICYRCLDYNTDLLAAVKNIQNNSHNIHKADFDSDVVKSLSFDSFIS